MYHDYPCPDPNHLSREMTPTDIILKEMEILKKELKEIKQELQEIRLQNHD